MKKTIALILLICIFFSSCSRAELIVSLEDKVSLLNQKVEALTSANLDLSEQVNDYKAMPTITPIPTLSPTPEPTPEPTPVPEPDDQIAGIILLFEKTGLPVEDIVYYDEITDPNGQLGRPNCYVGKANFNHPDCDEDIPCTIEIFTNQKDLDDREAYILSVFDTYPLVRQYMYSEGFALLRLPYDVLPSQASEYEKIFKEYWK